MTGMLFPIIQTTCQTSCSLQKTSPSSTTGSKPEINEKVGAGHTDQWNHNDGTHMVPFVEILTLEDTIFRIQKEPYS